MSSQVDLSHLKSIELLLVTLAQGSLMSLWYKVSLEYGSGTMITTTFSHYNSMGVNDPGGMANLYPRGMVGRIYVGDH